MKSRTFRTCQNFAKKLREMGYEKIGFRDLKYAVKVSIGGDKRTIEKYLHLLGEFGFISSTKHPTIFLVNEEPSSQRISRYFPKTIQQFLEAKSEDEPP